MKIKPNLVIQDEGSDVDTATRKINVVGSGIAAAQTAPGEVSLTFSPSSVSWGLTGNSGTSPGTNFLGTTDNQNLQIKTNNTLAGTVQSDGGWLIPGHMGLGANSSVVTGSVLRVFETVTTDKTLVGTTSTVTLDNVNASTRSIYGATLSTIIQGSLGKVSTTRGVSSSIALSSTAGGTLATEATGGSFSFSHIGTGTVTTLTGVNADLSISTSGGSAPVVTTLYGFKASYANSGGTVTTAIGLRLDDISSVGSTSWAIQSAGGQSYHVGNLRIGSTTAPTVALDVTGAASVSTQVTSPILSGGTSSGNDLTLKANDSSWPRTSRITADFITIGQSLTYPTGSAAAFNSLISSPSISSIDVASPNVTTVLLQPTWTYTVTQNWGLSPKYAVFAGPQLTSAVGASGSDTAIFVGIGAQPTVDLSSGPRTLGNLFGIQGDPRTSGTAGTVTTMQPVRSRGSLVSGTTATAVNAFISDFSGASGSTVTTYRGLYLAPTFSGTITNFEGVRIDDQSGPSGNNIGFYQRGTNAHNRLQGKLKIGADAAPAYPLDIVQTFTDTSGSLFVQQNVLTLSPSSNSTATAIVSDLQAVTASSAFNKATTLYGQRILMARNSTDSGAITTYTGLLVQPLNAAILSTGQGAVTDYTGLHVAPNDNSSTTTTTSTYRGVLANPSIGSNNVASRVYTTFEPAKFTWTYSSGSTSTTITDFNVINVDAAGNSVSRTGTITNAVGVNVSGWTTSGGLGSGLTFTNAPEQIRLQSMSISGSIGIRQQGATPHNRFEGKVIIGTDSAPAGYLEIKPAATTGTVVPDFKLTTASNTALTASTERITADFDPGSQQWATGALTTQRSFLFRHPTLSFVGASTATTVATVGITGLPVESTNATITDAVGLYVQSGGGTGATNSTGILVEAPAAGTNKWAIQTKSGGRVWITDSGTPVQGLFKVQNSSSVSYLNVDYLGVYCNTDTYVNPSYKLYGGTAASDNLTIDSTSDPTKGFIVANSSIKLASAKSLVFQQSTNTITISPPGSVTSHTLTLPGTLPASTSFVKVDSSGTMSYVTSSSSSNVYSFTVTVNGVGGSVTSSGDVDSATGGCEIVIPYASTLVAIGVAMVSARTAGTCTVKSVKNGSAGTETVVIDGTNTQYNYKVLTTPVSYAAGDRLAGQTVTSSFTPTGADAVITFILEKS
jgi:hypothetical protein